MSFGQPSSDINNNSAKFKLLVADRIVAKEIITSEIQLGDSTVVPLTFSTGFQVPVTINAVFERLSESLMCMTIPEISGINDNTSPFTISSDEVLPNTLFPVYNPSELKFTPYFETFPGPVTFYNACVINITQTGYVTFRFQFGSFSGSNNPVGFGAFTFVYNV